MAAAIGKLEVDIEVKSSPDEFWETIRNANVIYPKAFPNDYKNIEILEGDGKAVGSISLITYGDGSPLVKVSKERIDFVDEEKKIYAYSVIDGDLLNYYKSFKGQLVLTPKGDGSFVKWSCEYVKAKEDIPDPNIIKDFAVKNLLELDVYSDK
ncbi:MLP-like protein [Quillaja saponaria]|uniref:MLP-like protein n=1 Tax=Quillaja saponaria TaxID=32244 RepID=A0AAD7L8Z3_QUISA|nr:MLP-like protein [Quillaja saponaria]